MNHLLVYKQLIEMRIEALRDYATESDSTLTAKQKELDGELKSTLNETDDEDERQRLIDWFLDDNLKYFDDFPKLQRDALFLVIYSFFELTLSKICELIVRQAKFKKVTLTTPKQVYIHESKKFLTTHAKLKIKSKENIWKKLNELREYRNFIAHNGSNFHAISDAKDELKKRKSVAYINRYFKKPISTDHFEQCHIEKSELLLELIKLIEAYLYFVIQQASKKY